MDNLNPILILSSRPWNLGLADRLQSMLNRTVYCFSASEQLTPDSVLEIDPDWIFVPHWSHFIPESIWERWPTVIFHMTDLPYGRGGSPLQNLIQRGHTTTKLTALSCCEELDAGDIYLQESLGLHGTAEEIFLRTDSLVEQMIADIARDNPIPQPQQGEPVFFKRRHPSQSDLAQCPKNDLKTWYDYIRMLDADGYPPAYIDCNGFRLEFTRVSQRSDGLVADVKIKLIPTSV